jgi:hypothetical protein
VSTPADKPKPRRVPLGDPLTAEEIARRIGAGDTTAEAMEAMELWEQRAPTYAKKWLKAKPRER